MRSQEILEKFLRKNKTFSVRDDAYFYGFFYCIGSGEGSIKTKSSVKEASNITVQEQVISCPCEVNAPTACTVNLNASELILFHSRFVWISHHPCKSLMRNRLLWAYFLAPSDPVGFTYCGYHSVDTHHLLEITVCRCTVPQPQVHSLIHPTCSN